MKKYAIAAAVLLGTLLVLTGLWQTRWFMARLLPIHHTGEVMRIAQFHKGGIGRTDQDTRQIRQFAIIFADGFQCEGTDTSLAAIKEGDTIEIKGYHDVKGAPVLDPEWWECDEAQLVRIEQ